MAEVHPDPAVALSDSAQQMDIPEFEEFWNAILASNLVPHKIKYIEKPWDSKVFCFAINNPYSIGI